MPDRESEQPRLRVEMVEQPSGGGPWLTRFRIANAGDAPVRVTSAWMPHVVYRAEEIDLRERPPLAPGASFELDLEATYKPREDPGEPANPFLIMRLMWRDAEWRVLVQLSLTAGAEGAPALGIAAVSAHRVGFSNEPP